MSAVVRFADVSLHPTPDVAHEWVLPTTEVAAALGVDQSSIRSAKLRHADELNEGRHWGVANCNTLGGAQAQTVWTKRGVIRLSFFIRSPKAKAFRDFAEDLVLNVVEQRDHDALLARLATMEARLAALEAQPRQARLFALPPAQRKPAPVNHGAIVARKAEQRTKAIAAIAEGHGGSIRQLAMFLNVSWYTAHRIVAHLIKDGTVVAAQDIVNHNAIALRVVA